MSQIVLEVKEISKSYQISHEKAERYTSLRDTISNNVKSFINVIKNKEVVGQNTVEEFWALNDVSFSIEKGDRVGIIGRNGAGKSTLLKILSRITEPTKGIVSIKGRVASLLEVGTGFHPELTGRENVYLNGAILGMSRHEIKRKFDEIVAFAEVEKFLDTPVKRYSSGMYVRLAFAVAAHLEPEILIVDEVLAVGDAQFQKKCLGKMEDVSKNEGRTVLFVSHSMPTVTSLCNKGILLESGKISKMGNVSDVVMSYYSSGVASPTYIEYRDSKKIVGDKYLKLLSASIKKNGIIAEVEINTQESINIEMCYEVLKNPKNIDYAPYLDICTSEGSIAFCAGFSLKDNTSVGIHTAVCTIPSNFLNDMAYFVSLGICSEGGTVVHFYEQNILSFNIKDDIHNSPTRLTGFSGKIPGAIRPLLEWSIT